MTHQAALTPGRFTIWRQFFLTGTDQPAINAAPWHDAIAQQRLVGTCRCGGYLAPETPYDVGTTTWYPTRCVGRDRGDRGCGQEPAAAGPRPKPKPKARERPVD